MQSLMFRDEGTLKTAQNLPVKLMVPLLILPRTRFCLVFQIKPLSVAIWLVL